MKVHVNAVHFTVDNGLVEFIQKKLNKLETFYDRIISSEVFLRLDKGDKSKTHIKQIEIKLNVPGSTLFVSERGSTFEEATDLAMDVLSRQVKRFKEKQLIISHDRPTVSAPAEVEEDFED